MTDGTPAMLKIIIASRFFHPRPPIAAASSTLAIAFAATVRKAKGLEYASKMQTPSTSLPPEDVSSAKSILRRIQSFRGWRGLLLGALFVILLFGWLASPPGLLGKADAIGYAVCHRIDLRSFHLGDRQLPLCARCTGTFLGTIVGVVLLILAGRGRSAVWPPRRILALLALTVAAWGLDGANSYASFFPRLPHIYEPQNWLRLTTGTLLGMAMAVVFLPAVNQSLWKEPSSVPAIRNLRELVLFFLPAPLLIGLVLLENPIILYPLAVLSTLGILFLLTGVYTALLLMLFRKEGQAGGWREAWPAVAGGFALALLQIYAIDAVRYHLTGTWGGFG
jgi:uncharacterized membrane protein